MSYQLYVTGGYGFTESILPSLLHPSEAVSIAQDYFSRGYQGAHIEPAPDSGLRDLAKASNNEQQAMLEALQNGQLVLAQQSYSSFGLFTGRNATPQNLRTDLPQTLRRRLQAPWSSGLSGTATAVKSDSLYAPANAEYYTAPEPVAEVVPEKGPNNLTISYRWPDGTGVAGLPFQVGTDHDSVRGTLDHQGAATVEGLNGRFATVRLGSNASDDTVNHERKAIIAGLDRLLEAERKETEAKQQEYQALLWFQKPAVSAGALFQGAYDAGIGLYDFVAGVSNLTSPVLTLRDSLQSAWAANKDNSGDSWFEAFNRQYDEKRHEHWVRAIGFSPSDISREDIAKAYEVASLVIKDDQLSTALKEFTANYAAIQHHTEYTYLAGAVAFELVLAAVLAATTLGAGNVAQASSKVRHTRVLAGLGPAFGRFADALKLQGLRRVWRERDLNKNNHFEDKAPPRGEGVDPELPVQRPKRPKKVLPTSFDEAKAYLSDARAAIIANGKPPPPKYTHAQLRQIAEDGFGDEKYIVRLVEEPHLHRNGPNNGTLGKEGPAGVQIWSTSFDQIAHLDSDPKLITDALGVNYKPDAKYKLAIVDQGQAVKHADAETIVPTFKILTNFTETKLPNKVENPQLVKEVMTPEYSREYAGLVRGMPEGAWQKMKLREQYLASKGLDSPAMDKFETRFSIQKNTGANEHFTGNGLTKTTTSLENQPVYGTVEVFSLHKNPKSFKQMTGLDGDTKWVELVDLETINFGV